MMSARSDTTIERVLAGEEPYDGRWSVQAGANRSWEGSRNSTSRSVCTTPVCRGPRRMTTALPPSARRVALPGERTGTPGARGHQRLGKVHLRGGGAASVTHLPFINADEIAARSWPGEEAQRAYDASRAAATARAEGISGRRSFITETVFSHPSKLELIEHAVSAGYLVTLHSILVPEDVAVMRVGYRVARGGHTVPEAKIRERYRRLWMLVALARGVADRAFFSDNSRARTPFSPIAAYERGRRIGHASWPLWTPSELLS